MSHLTDGEIHVHLDGALDLLPDRRAAEIREHLSRCEDCQSRLEEERRVRARASRILGSSASGADETPELPSFDTIRERARGRGEPGAGALEGPPSNRRTDRSSGPSRQAWYRGIAWAATVVISLGLGWYARSGVVEIDGRSQAVLRSPIPSATAEVEGTARGPETETGRAGTAGSGTAGDDAVGATPARARQQEAPSGATALAEREEASPGAEEVESAEARTAALLQQGATPVEGSLAVTGLPVVSVAWETDTDRSDPVLRVVQRLPSGDTLTLRYSTPAAADSSGFADRRDADPGVDLDAAPRAPAPEAEVRGEPERNRATSVTRPHGPWMLEATAPLEPDSVRALLDRIPPR